MIDRYWLYVFQNININMTVHSHFIPLKVSKFDQKER